MAKLRPSRRLRSRSRSHFRLSLRLAGAILLLLVVASSSSRLALAQVVVGGVFPPGATGSGGGTGNAAAVVTTTFSATPTFTCPSATAGTVVDFKLSTALTTNITSSTSAACTTGAVLNFIFTQDGTGGRTVAMPTGFSSACQVSPIASATTKMSFAWDGTTGHLLSCNADLGPTLFTSEQAAPGTPPANQVYCWPDSTDHAGIACKANSSANVFKLVLASVDINPVTGQVVASHFASPLPKAQGGAGADMTNVTFPSSGTIAILGANTFTGRQDLTGAASTAPAKAGTSLPGTCIVGDLYFKTDATAGQNLYECAGTNTWTQQLNSGGGASVGGGISVWAPATALSLTGTMYASAGGAAQSATEANVYVKASGAMSASGLQVNIDSAPGGGNSIAFTLRVAGSDSTLTCTIADPATSCQDITHTVSIAQNNLLSIKFVTTGTVVGTRTPTVMIQFGTGVQDPGGNGVVVRSALNTTINRTLTAGLGISIADGTGVSGNPTITNSLVLPYGSVFDGGGSAILTSTPGYFTIPYACTIKGYDILAVGVTGNTTFKFWRIPAATTGLPTIAGVINTSGITIGTGDSGASGYAVGSSTTSDFTSTAIAAGDKLAVIPTTVSGTTLALVSFRCQ